jgi:hypothetical protein
MQIQKPRAATFFLVYGALWLIGLYVVIAIYGFVTSAFYNIVFSCLNIAAATVILALGWVPWRDK